MRLGVEMRQQIRVLALVLVPLGLTAALFVPRVEALFAADTVDGISRVPRTRANLAAPAFSDVAAATTAGRMNFEPRTEFVQSIPLQLYMNPLSRAFFLSGPRSGTGNGVILDVSSFNVTGYSPPNALAWNSVGVNADGSVPALPQLVYFFINLQRISMNVASNTSAGETAALVALSPRFEVLAIDSVTLTPNVQTLEVASLTRNIQFAVIAGPEVMIADDFVFE